MTPPKKRPPAKKAAAKKQAEPAHWIEAAEAEFDAKVKALLQLLRNDDQLMPQLVAMFEAFGGTLELAGPAVKPRMHDATWLSGLRRYRCKVEWL